MSSSSDADAEGPRWPVAFWSDSEEDLLIHEYMLADNKWLDDLEEVDLDYIRELRQVRLGRRVLTWMYSGNLLQCIEGEHPIVGMNWDNLPADERNRRWMDLCRMTPAAFDELYDMVVDHIPDTRPVIPTHRQYSKRIKLLVTLYFLAHVPTLRCMSRLFGIPHNSVSEICVKPVLAALEHALLVVPETKQIRFPRAAAEQRRVVREFKNNWKLPAVGAVDGSLIPQRKPSREQAQGDSDAFWSYKGSPASLLLAICDANGRFLYVNAGAPGTVGDAGLWSRSDLCQLIEEGLFHGAPHELTADGHTQSVQPFLVGDAAFPLGPHMMKVWDEARPQDRAHWRAAGKGKFNRCVINCRRGIECTFGRLKGRWAFCRRNTFIREPKLISSAVRVCCALHNFVERLGMEYEEEWAAQGGAGVQVANVGPAPPAQAGVGGVAAQGRAVREFLTKYVNQAM